MKLSLSVFLLVLLGCLAVVSEAAIFTCNATTTATCQSIIDFVPTKISTYRNLSALFQVSLSSIFNENNLSSTTSSGDDFVNPGDLVKIPIPCLCSHGTGQSNHKPVYTIQSGDSLDSIARYTFNHFVDYKEMAYANNITDANKIEVRQKLYIPLPCSCDPVDGARVVHLAYQVEYANTVASIAEMFGTTESTLLRLNGISEPNELTANQILDVPLGQGIGTLTVHSKSKARKTVMIMIIVASIVLMLLGVLGIFIWIRRKQQRDVDIDLLGLLDKPNVFSYNEIRSATQGFSHNNILGEGGYGAVYKVGIWKLDK